MEIVFYSLVFIFGAAIGSFLNVVIFRYHSGATFLGRSMCFSCGKTLRWHDLIPVLSFAALAGKCRFCRSKISWHYAAVEIFTGVLFALVLWETGGALQLLNAVTFMYFANLSLLLVSMSLLVVIGGYDIRHKIIPDVFAYSFAGTALLELLLFPLFVTPASSWDLLAGPILAFPFALLWYVSGGKWMGLGDAKLALGIGWFLGLRGGFVAIIIAFWIGAIFGLALIAAGKFMESSLFVSLFRQRITMKSEIPFAPFLIGGLLLTFFVPYIMSSAVMLLY